MHPWDACCALKADCADGIRHPLDGLGVGDGLYRSTRFAALHDQFDKLTGPLRFDEVERVVRVAVAVVPDIQRFVLSHRSPPSAEARCRSRQRVAGGTRIYAQADSLAVQPWFAATSLSPRACISRRR